MTFISLSTVAQRSFGGAMGLVGFHSSDVASIRKDFHFTCREKSQLVKATVVNCWVFYGQASEGGLKVHFITLGSQRKSLSGTIAFPF